MITTIDVETTYQKTETGGFDPSPFNPSNILVSVGINDEYYFTNHSERIDEGCFHKIQKILDEKIPYDSVCFKDASGTAASMDNLSITLLN